MSTILGPVVPLEMMRPGERGQVVSVHGSTQQVHRLREMGLRDGRLVEMIRAGSPCIVRIDGHSLCLRGDGLMQVLVRTEGAVAG